ncbi:tyrosine-type recombinase/integrase [Mycolicibacterium llatzerense]|uniref:tyrosine-type recombinase/integrase n=1 Tax=Mycolicibacterium llatzerense TaxID=280871 RepID=UPI0021B6DC1B|nr:site-specific integrase [Mycolicibacterium llatzerense]MCT7365630.1 hypothetical protein [Mycolicibacterium llatzerense]
MAWVASRNKKDGTPFWSVYWRESGRGSKTQCISWETREDADHCKKLVDEHGGDRAREIMRIVAAPRQAQTVAQYLTKHIDHLTGIEPGTIKKYRAYVRNDLGAIATIPLTALKRTDMAQWVNTMNEADEDGNRPSGKTISNKHGFIAGALNAAVAAGLIKSNPCDGNRLPRWDREEMVFLEREEFAILLSSVPEYWRPLVQFLVSSGCRWSEATALKPRAVDLAAGTVRITKAWKAGATGGYELGVPKTKKSVRTINVPKRVLEQLDLSGEWVFTNSGRGKGQFAGGALAADAGPVRIHSFNPNVWVPAVARAQAAGLGKRPRTHDLRHTCASWLIQAGRPLPAIQAHLGHESITTTVNTYGHLDRSSGSGNADAIDAMLA